MDLIGARATLTPQVKDISDSLAIVVLERSSGKTAAVKIIQREKLTDWLQEHLKEWPPDVFRIAVCSLAPMFELAFFAAEGERPKDIMDLPFMPPSGKFDC